MDAYDLNADIDVILTQIQDDSFLINSSILNVYSNLLQLKPTHSLGAAKNEIRAAIDDYFTASNFIRNESDPLHDDFIVLDLEEEQDESDFRNTLSDIKASLNGPVFLGDEGATNPFRIDLTQLFDDPLPIRGFLPQFTDVMKSSHVRFLIHLLMGSYRILITMKNMLEILLRLPQ